MKESIFFRKIVSEMEKKLDIPVKNYKLSYIRRRISSRMKRCGFENFEDYYRYLKGNPREYDELFMSLSINVTQFFRNPEVFEKIKEIVLPEMLKIAKNRITKSINIWSVGCADGREPYSMAILLIETIKERYNINIIGTDISKKSINFAKKGVYKSTPTDNIESQLTFIKNRISRYFEYEDGVYMIKDNVKRYVKFIEHNIITDEPLKNMDIVMCRNLKI